MFGLIFLQPLPRLSGRVAVGERFEEEGREGDQEGSREAGGVGGREGGRGAEGIGQCCVCFLRRLVQQCLQVVSVPCPDAGHLVFLTRYPRSIAGLIMTGEREAHATIL